ncbi:MAG: hypothetical protein QF685_06800 [Verrucomicrobiota bacterium]|jgi:hypothetical protein|nr:hypothetical protein [Verrucomicrobiota bacterium]|tara:strand:- start:249 stop:422 length:174 start_codon:yes stop_codon:yes gene_type:complete
MKKLKLTLAAFALTVGLLAIIGCGGAVKHDPDAHLAGSEEEADEGDQTIPEEESDPQ